MAIKKKKKLEVVTPKEVKPKRIGSALTKDDQVQGGEMSATIRTLRSEVMKLIESGKVDKLAQVTLENWAIMLSSDNDSERAFATERISKYIFAPKKEVISIPVININCSFVGIKDDKKD
jgi:hypothetical protein